MKPLSDTTRALIGKLSSCFIGWRQKSANDVVALIQEIAKQNEWQSVICLAPYLMDRDGSVAAAAGNAIESILSAVPAATLCNVDEAFRAGLWSLASYRSNWDTIRASELDKFAAGEKKAVLLGIVSFHRSGYVREVAVKRLATIADGSELPFLLIRLSDWVPQVRQLARQVVEQRIRDDYARHFTNDLDLLERLRLRKRLAGSDLCSEAIEKVEKLLRSSLHARLLLDGLSSGRLEVRRCCLALFLKAERSSDDTLAAIKQILRDKDMTIRRHAFEMLMDLPVPERSVFLKQLQQDKAAVIRKQALEFLCAGMPLQARVGDSPVAAGSLVVAGSPADPGSSDAKASPDGAASQVEYLKQSLLDISSVVREYARWKLGSSGVSICYREFYRQEIQHGKSVQHTASAAAGLGETGQAADAKELAALISHREVRVRRAAIRAISKLDAPAYVDSFLFLLSDASPGVSREACAALIQQSGQIRAGAVMDTFAKAHFFHSRRNAVRVLNHLSKWDRISCLLLAAAQSDSEVRDLLLQSIESWENKYRTTWQFTSPTKEQLDRFALGMMGAGPILPEPTFHTLEACLKFYEPDSRV